LGPSDGHSEDVKQCSGWGAVCKGKWNDGANKEQFGFDIAVKKRGHYHADESVSMKEKKKEEFRNDRFKIMGGGAPPHS